MNIKPAAYSYELAHSMQGARLSEPGEYCDWRRHLSENMPNVPAGSIRNLQPLYALPPTPLTAHLLVEDFLTKASLPTTDGTVRVPVPIEKVRELLKQVVTLDRAAGAQLDINSVVSRVMGDTIGSDRLTGLEATNMVRTALQYAQASGARFAANTPTEVDYAEAVGAACETFMAVLKDKGHG